MWVLDSLAGAFVPEGLATLAALGHPIGPDLLLVHINELLECRMVRELELLQDLLRRLASGDRPTQRLQVTGFIGRAMLALALGLVPPLDGKATGELDGFDSHGLENRATANQRGCSSLRGRR